MTPTPGGKSGEATPWFRPWIPALLIGVIAAISIGAYGALAALEPRALAHAQKALEDESGRTVTIEGFRLALPVRIDRITIAGDGVIDSGPLLVLRDISAWPDIASLLRFQPRLGLLQADSAVLRLRESGGNWSTRGAFTRPAADEPALGSIALPDLAVHVDAHEQAWMRRLRINIDFARRGSYTLFFHGDEAHGRVHYSGQAPGASYKLDVTLDRLPENLRQAERFRLVGNYYVDSSLVDFALDGTLADRPSHLSGRVRFDATRIQTESAAWTHGSQSGRLILSYDHARNRRIDLISAGRLTLPLPLPGMSAEPLTRGTLHLDRLSLTGPLSGPWQATVSVVGHGLEASGPIELVAGALDGEVAIEVKPDRSVTLLHSKAKISFARARASGYTVENAEVDVDASPRAVVVTGRARALGGTVKATDVRVRLDPDGRPSAVEGRLTLESLGGRELSDMPSPVSLSRLSGSYDVEAVRTGSSWRLVTADGFTEKVDGVYRGEPFTVSQAHVIARGQPGEAGSIFSFNGYVRIFGGRGRLRAEIDGRDRVDARMELHDIDLAAANRVFRNPRLEAISRHVDRVSMIGRLGFSTDDPVDSGFVFDGTLNADGLGIEVGPEEAFAASEPESQDAAMSPAEHASPRTGQGDAAAAGESPAQTTPPPASLERAGGEPGGGGGEAGNANGLGGLSRDAIGIGPAVQKAKSVRPPADGGLSTALDLVSMFRFDGLPMQVRARGRVRVESGDDGFRMSGLELTIDTDRTVLAIDTATFRDSAFHGRIQVRRIDAEHLKLFARHLAPNPLTESLPIRGALHGRIDFEREPERFYANLDLMGDLELRGSPLRFHATGDLHELGPGRRTEENASAAIGGEVEPGFVGPDPGGFINIVVDTISLDALHQSLADLNLGVDRTTVALEGHSEVTLVLSDRWDSLVTTGRATLRGATLSLPADSITARGLNGDISFRVRKGRLERLEGLPTASALTCERLMYNTVSVENISGFARFNEKQFLFERMNFRLAGGHCSGAFTIDFPRWDRPRTAFFGRVKDCNLETIYRQMQPFEGNLTGLASGTVELLMDQDEFQKLEISGTARNGVISTKLLTPVIEKLETGVIRNALESLIDWQYDSASFQARYKPNTYSPFDAEGLFLDPRRTSEVPLSFAIRGMVYPFQRAQILHLPTPFARIGIPLELQSPNLPLRLTLYRVGRRVGR